MKKIFQMIGLIGLTCFSFFITEKTAIVVNNMDDIMIEIKSNYENYNSKPIDAIIEGDTIIPGINGKQVNINKSYKNMKLNGYYSDKFYIYDYNIPNISINDNLDKYIIKGNPNKRMVSLIFTVLNNDDITEILNIVENYNIKVTFFVEIKWFTQNNQLIQELINNGHNIGVFIDNYSDADYEWIDMVIKNINKQKNGWCYNTNNNKENIDFCKLKNNYTIAPIKINSKFPLSDIKENLISGSLLSLEINSQVRKELSTIIIYIKSKGLSLDNIENHLLE